MITPLANMGWEAVLLRKGESVTLDTIAGQVDLHRIKQNGRTKVTVGGKHMFVRVVGRELHWIAEVLDSKYRVSSIHGPTKIPLNALDMGIKEAISKLTKGREV
jgi:hypothetical protein